VVTQVEVVVLAPLVALVGLGQHLVAIRDVHPLREARHEVWVLELQLAHEAEEIGSVHMGLELVVRGQRRALEGWRAGCGSTDLMDRRSYGSARGCSHSP
jgi:hypothetical protein